jgi:hypothetical protein
MNDILGLFRAALADPNAHGYLLFGFLVFVTVLALLSLISAAFKSPDRERVVVRDRHRAMRSRDR